MIPEGAEILPNQVGTAPGIKIELGGAKVCFLPGVPRELYQIFDDSVMPWLSSESDTRYEQRILRCFGLPEADFAEKLKDIDIGEAQLAYQVKYPDILLRLTAYHQDTDEARQRIDSAAKNIYDCLEDLVYGEGETTLQEVVGKQLRDAQMTLAAAESCTGGQVASFITDIPGASEYFERGVVTYSNRSKQELLGVSPETMRANGAVSSETAMAMAEGVRRISDTTLGVALTGIAGPGGSSPEKPTGTVYIALAAPEGTEAQHYVFARDRIWFKKMAATAALDMIRRYLLKAKR
jgi:nicotinamide-nucleotide amidase